jgi:hypothetical protein
MELFVMPDCPCPSSLLPAIIVCSHLIVSAKPSVVVATLAPVPSQAFDLGNPPSSLGVAVLVWSLDDDICKTKNRGTKTSTELSDYYLLMLELLLFHCKLAVDCVAMG